MKITLHAASVALLRSILETPGWAKSVGLIYQGGKLLSEVLPEAKPPTGADMDEWKEWAKVSAEFEFTEKQFEVCRNAIKHFAQEGKISAGLYSLKLLTAFNLTED